MSKKILILTAPIGMGHVKVAEALKENFSLKLKDIEVEIIDIFNFFPAFIGKIILNSYAMILKYCPSLYGRMYQASNSKNQLVFFKDFTNSFLAKRIYKFILNYNPDIIINTHATPGGLISYLKKKNLITIPSFAVVTDFVVHKFWVYKELDGYFVSTEEMQEYLKEQGIEENKIMITGIPLRSAFEENTKEKKELAEIFYLNNEITTVLIMGGGAGFLPMAEIIEMFKKKNLSVQLILVAGKNENLYNKLIKIAEDCNNLLKIKVFGYVENIAELMICADLLISKPGGVTCAEALAKKLPIVIYKPLPGVEQKNTEYLINNKFAICADSSQELVFILKDFISEESIKLKDIKDKISLFNMDKSASNTTNFLIEKYLS